MTEAIQQKDRNLKFVNIHDAKTNLSKYLDQICKDHSALIICKNGVPICQITEYKKPGGVRLGLLKGQIKMSDDFDDELPDEFWNFNEDLNNPK